MFRKRIRKIPKREGKKVIWRFFITLGSPRLASGSLGPPNNLRVKQPTRLGELLINQVPSFPINRLEGAEGDFQHQKDLVKLRRRRRKEKKK